MGRQIRKLRTPPTILGLTSGEGGGGWEKGCVPGESGNFQAEGRCVLKCEEGTEAGEVREGIPASGTAGVKCAGTEA